MPTSMTAEPCSQRVMWVSSPCGSRSDTLADLQHASDRRARACGRGCIGSTGVSGATCFSWRKLDRSKSLSLIRLPSFDRRLVTGHADHPSCTEIASGVGASWCSAEHGRPPTTCEACSGRCISRLLAVVEREDVERWEQIVRELCPDVHDEVKGESVRETDRRWILELQE